MPLAPNTRLGRYEIRQLLGAGGMGEVYLAQDVELRRPVALKFLKAEVADDEKRMHRFMQEARAASALNHPNILTVYEIGQAEGASFFATEFVDGQTLRALLASRRMKLVEVLDMGVQIASALVAAHAAGIVHRDIKPDNVMIRRDGYVKVLDFGLAKLTDGGTSQVDTEAATRALVNTDPGAVMGTVNYMSPEQASGREVDARTDIWSLGCVLYEMVTGHVPFEGSTPSHVIVAILEKEPLPLSAYVENLPEALEWIVAEALTKDREERTQTARELLKRLQRLKQRADADAEIERSVAPERLSSVASGASGSAASIAGATSSAASGTGQQNDPSALTITESTAAGTGEVAAARETSASSAEYAASGIKRHKKVFALLLVLALLVLVGTSFALYKLVWQRASGQIVSLQSAKFTRLTTTGKASVAAISPDGKWLVHVMNDGGQQSLWLRQVAVTNSNTQIIPPAEVLYTGLTFSPDGNYIYYAVYEKNDLEGTLYQVPVLGGAARKLLKGINTAVTFSPDGKQIAYFHFIGDEDRLMVANADGTAERQLAMRHGNEYFYSGNMSSLSWSPDGKLIASPVGNDAENYMSVVTVSAETGEIRFFTKQRWYEVKQVAWLPDGKTILLTTREQVSTPFKIWQLSYPTGEAQTLTNDLNSYPAISLTADASLLAMVQSERASNIWVMPANDSARAVQITQGRNLHEAVSWTPDGKLIYASDASGNRELYLIDSRGGEAKQLTADSRPNGEGSVTPDGRYIVFTSERSGVSQVWRMDVDGGNLQQLTEKNGFHQSISPDGQWIAYESEANKTTIWRVGINGGQAVQLTDKQAFLPAFSPDGKQVACYYFSQEGATVPFKLAILPFEGGAPVKTFTLPTGVSYMANLRWSTDGRAIIYILTRGGVSNLWAQPIDGSAPKQLTNFTSDLIFWFDYSRDAKQLALSRGTVTSDVILISDFKH